MSSKAEACAFSVGQDNNEKVSAGWEVFLCRNANGATATPYMMTFKAVPLLI